MSATKYQLVLAGFQNGWAKLGNKRFDVVIFAPSYQFQNPDGSNNFPWNREKDYYVAKVRLPHSDDTDKSNQSVAYATSSATQFRTARETHLVAESREPAR